MQLYTGVVENRLDPLKLGRCQVRVVGLHTHDKSLLKTEDLPWAFPMQPSTSAAISGVGQSPVGPVEGTWVVVMFRDYPENQQPIILGSIGGIPQDFGSVDQDDNSMVLRNDAGVAKNTGVVTDNSGNVNQSGETQEETQSTTPTYDGLRPARDFSEVSSDGIALIKQFEGLRLVSYQDSNGWAVGYGTTRINNLPVQANRRITAAEAETYLNEDLKNQFLPAVKQAVRTLVTQSMIDALVCLAYNIGVNALKTSTLVKELNSGRYLDAAARFLDWNKESGKVSKGLTRRRTAEKDLFLKDGIPNIAGDLSSFQQEEAPVGENKSTGQADRGAALQLGFRDPKGKYPLYKNEPDTNRLARHEEIGKTVVFRKEAARDKGVPIANSSETWDQSPIPYNAQYPFNHVYFTESGHIMEFDDTERSERINIYHKAGTFTEIDANGTQVNRIVGDGYEILERNGYIHIFGSQFVTIEGAQKVKVKNTFDLEVDGAATINIYNNATVNVGGNATMSVDGSFNLSAGSISLGASTINLNSDTINLSANNSVNFSTPSVSGLEIDNFIAADNHSNEITGTGGSASVPSPNLGTRSIIIPTINELTVITRGAATAQTYETPEEGNSDAYRARQLEKGNLPSDEIDTGTTSGTVTAPSNQVQPTGANCNLIYGMDKFSPSLVLSKHFTLGRLTSGGTRMPVSQFGLSPQEIVCNLKGLAENCLEPIIELYPNMIITNAFRRPGDVSGSSKTSQHYLGQAADIVLPGFSRTEVYEKIQEIQQLIPYDQLLLEYSGSRTVWIHVSFKYTGNRKVAFTMRDHKRISNPGSYTLIA
jgi:GH24 family phage-related lysozyme (muramidase)